ncbi:hypothetical protein P3S68_030595 [Capsicum galapagoense]
MGNCVDTLILSPTQELNDLDNDHEQVMNYYVVQQCHSPRCASNDNNNDSCKSIQRIKIVISKQQLEVLVNNVKEIHRVRESCKKWKPSLATIYES